MILTETTTAGRLPRAFSRAHFRQIAVGGFGDGHNSYAYGYAWFNEHVYIGTNRDILVMTKTRLKYDVPAEVWPIELPDPAAYRDPDPGGQIWRYDPQSDIWKRVYYSPLVEGTDGRPTPLATGFRNMVVFQGRSDPHPALYTVPSCGSLGRGPVLLRSLDGEQFEQVSDHGLGLGDPNITAFRSLVAFKGRLFMTPAGSRGGDPNVSYHAAILASDDPARGGWQKTNQSSFGEPTNYGIYDMCVCGDWLYAGTMNLRQGCQLWKTRGEGEPPFEWIKVFERGAERGSFNQGSVCLAELGGNVYVGTGIQNGGYDRVNNIGPGAGEILRAYPDDTWDVVVGEPRLTLHGLKVPKSGYGPGFNNPFAGYMWRMCQHEGALYVGTFDGSSMFRFNPLDQRARRIFDGATLEQFMQARGGCELWRTVDGDHWVPVTRNGFDNGYNWGIRTLLSTPRGLFVGTANPFGPRVAVRGAAGWRYVDNPRGGVEVWHGAWQHAGVHDPEPDDEPPLAFSSKWPEKGLAPLEDSLTSLPDIPLEPSLAPRDQAPPQDAAGGPDGDQLLDQQQAGSAHAELLSQLWDDLPSSPSQWQQRRWHSSRKVLRHEFRAAGGEPALRLAAADRLHTVAPALAAEIDDYFHGTRMRSVGYWNPRVRTPAQACRMLVEELVTLLDPDRTPSFGASSPAPSPLAAGHPRSILVVAAAADDVAGEIAHWLPQAELHACNGPALWPWSDASQARARAALDAEAARLGPAVFDAVLWIEGPHLAAGGGGLAWASQRLRPGGRLVAADLIGHSAAELERAAPRASAEAAAVYREAVAAAGLLPREVIDATHSGWVRFSRHARRHFTTKLLFHLLDEPGYETILSALPGGALLVDAYLLVSALKPVEIEPSLPGESG